MDVLVTGATGFYGGAIARRFAREGHRVTGTGRRLDQGARLEQDGVRFIPASLSDAPVVRELCRGRDLVVHSAALSSPWGSEQAFLEANVAATDNVLAGCREARVGRLVHISSPSIYGHEGDRILVREDAPLSPRGLTTYARTKLMAEQLVDRAAREGLVTLTIRPRALFGPGDTTVLPIVRALESRRLPVIGRGDNVVDLTYIDNAVEAVVLAARAPASLSGRKFNVTNGEPIALWPTIRKLCALLGLEAPTRRLNASVATAIATGMEWRARLTRSDQEPLMTRYSVAVLSNTTTLDIGAARRDLGYQPLVDVDEGMRRFAAWWKDGRP